MKRNYTSLTATLFITAVLLTIYFTMMPQWISNNEPPLSEFSTKRALQKISVIAQKPHFVGSQNHKEVAKYLETELNKLGLETQIQEGTTLSDWGNLVKSRNIMARIKGSSNSKALLLLSHYDSAPHSYSHGAADDASGVAVILESIRAFLHDKTAHKNDIIILFTDAEELGLNGAALFVEQSKWKDHVGLVLNFEARGTAGPGYMLMEVTGGNSALVDNFANASPKFPVSNSLMYSIYKMLPNDTDLTVFREQGNIQGFNFAFIDDHFNYHTSQDDLAHLSEKSVSHQGSYLMALLPYFSNADLTNLNSSEEQVYFNTPFFFFHYSFTWIYPMLIVAFVLFLFLTFVGIGKRILVGREIGKGFIALLGSLLVSGLVGFLGWKLLLVLYPQYNEILHGFTYNGHSYIAAFVFITLAICFLFYRKADIGLSNVNYMIAPIVFWLLINLGVALFLPGAAFLIIPVFSALLMFGYSIITQRRSLLVNAILSIPVLVLLTPFIVMFPIGLGLKILFGSAILLVLTFSLLLPLVGSYAKKELWSILCILVGIGFVIHAHLNADYQHGTAKPNSLLYVYDADEDRAVWATYDKKMDEWTKIYLTDSPKSTSSLSDIPLFSKYGTQITMSSPALVRNLPEPTIEFLTDSIGETQHYYSIKITPQRNVNRYDIFADDRMTLHNLIANGAKPIGQKGSLLARNGKKILSYYVVDNEPLQLKFSIPITQVFDMELLESSFDLLDNPLFEMHKRPKDKMPKPFILNDAISIRKKIRPKATATIPIPVQKNFTLSRSVENDTIPDPDSGIIEEIP